METFQKSSDEKNEIAYAKLTRYKACHGCNEFIEGEAYIFCRLRIQYKLNGLICPCSTCLIKMICTKECENFKYFKNIVFKKESN